MWRCCFQQIAYPQPTKISYLISCVNSPMPQSADISSKKLISLAPDNWVKWVTQIPDITAQEILNSEFQWISRESDVLIRAESPQYGQFLVLNELQLRYKPE
ncbi:MAG: hypothetical protein ACRDEA_16555, partial [Microcystaceae cyanobacterium]